MEKCRHPKLFYQNDVLFGSSNGLATYHHTGSAVAVGKNSDSQVAGLFWNKGNFANTPFQTPKNTYSGKITSVFLQSNLTPSEPVNNFRRRIANSGKIRRTRHRITVL